MTIQQMQEAIIAKGYVFQEQYFPNGETYIQFCKTDAFNPYADGVTYLSGWEKGWGRFPRQQAWEWAYAELVK